MENSFERLGLCNDGNVDTAVYIDDSDDTFVDVEEGYLPSSDLDFDIDETYEEVENAEFENDESSVYANLDED